MKYIEKTGVQDSAGHENLCWVAVSGGFDLASNNASIWLQGYKDKDAFLAGMKPADSKMISVKLSDLLSFEAVWGELAMKLVSEGTFEGGTIKDTEEST